MGRACLCSFAGAGLGLLAACVLVQAFAGRSAPSDNSAITLFVGTFLSGTGAIAGAIVGKCASQVNSLGER